MGLLAGASFSVKYTIGLPLILTIILALWFYRKNLKPLAFVMAPLGFVIAFQCIQSLHRRQSICNPSLDSKNGFLLSADGRLLRKKCCVFLYDVSDPL